MDRFKSCHWILYLPAKFEKLACPHHTSLKMRAQYVIIIALFADIAVMFLACEISEGLVH